MTTLASVPRWCVLGLVKERFSRLSVGPLILFLCFPQTNYDLARKEGLNIIERAAEKALPHPCDG